MPEKKKRVTITLDSKLLEEAQKDAKRMGLSFSAYVEHCIREYIKRYTER